MLNKLNYAKALKVLGIVCGVSLLVLILSTLLVMAGGTTATQPDMAVTGSIFAVLVSCVVSAFSFLGILLILILRRRASLQADRSSLNAKRSET